MTSSVKVFTTMGKFIKFDFVSYEQSLQFGINQENRAYNQSHLEKIKRQIRKSFDTMPPITINTITNHIVDGQHRLKAYQELYKAGELPMNANIKVMFVEIPFDEEKQEIINANTNSKNWSMDDYITSFAKGGIVSFVKLDNWCKTHSLTSEKGKSKFRYGAAIITGRRCEAELKKGTFTFTEEQIQRAEDVHTELLEIVELLEMKGRGMWIESLATSWVAVRTQHKFRTWMKELQRRKQRFLKMPKDNSRDWDAIFAAAHLEIDMKK